jgi:DNA-binding CsgD family transcriptional regulator
MSVKLKAMTADLLDAHPCGLTLGETRLLNWVAAGRTNAQIGRCSGRSEKTIRNQLTRVYAKLDVVNRAEAVAVYLRCGRSDASAGGGAAEDRDIRPIGVSKPDR